MCLLRGTFYILRSAHTVYLCVLCGSENRPIISLYSINWLIFIAETECVYWAVRSAHTVYLCALFGSENKQRLFHCTALTGWFLELRRSVFTARYGLGI